MICSVCTGRRAWSRPRKITEIPRAVSRSRGNLSIVSDFCASIIGGVLPPKSSLARVPKGQRRSEDFHLQQRPAQSLAGAQAGDRWRRRLAGPWRRRGRDVSLLPLRLSGSGAPLRASRRSLTHRFPAQTLCPNDFATQLVWSQHRIGRTLAPPPQCLANAINHRSMPSVARAVPTGSVQ
jgi:hypothetical protein